MCVSVCVGQRTQSCCSVGAIKPGCKKYVCAKGALPSAKLPRKNKSIYIHLNFNYSIMFSAVASLHNQDEVWKMLGVDADVEVEEEER